jgi:DNA-binding response OmpR family regulator
MASVKTLLIAEDKTSMRQMLRDFFAEQGYRVITASDGREALIAAKQEKPDLVIVDVMMPEVDGYEFVRHFRRDSTAPVIMLTAKMDEMDKVLGLELGADDYVTKPFSPRELLARVRAALRRASAEVTASRALRVGELTLDQDTRLVKVNERVLEVTPSEFEILSTLMAAPGRVFTRRALLAKLSGAASVERTVDVHVRNLRAKLESDSANPRYIETVFGVGYRLRDEQE